MCITYWAGTKEMDALHSGFLSARFSPFSLTLSQFDRRLVVQTRKPPKVRVLVFKMQSALSLFCFKGGQSNVLKDKDVCSVALWNFFEWPPIV